METSCLKMENVENIFKTLIESTYLEFKKNKILKENQEKKINSSSLFNFNNMLKSSNKNNINKEKGTKELENKIKKLKSKYKDIKENYRKIENELNEQKIILKN